MSITMTGSTLGFLADSPLPLHLGHLHINWLAVVAAALAAFFIGAIWYTALFGKLWVKMQGLSEEQVKQMQAKMKPPVFFGGMLIAYFVLSFVMAIVVSRIGITEASGGIKLGLAFWGATASVGFTHHMASGKRLGAFLIDAGCELVYLLAMGLILALWR